MPKSMADKPPKYDTCDDHPKHLKDQFCCDHGILICSTCRSNDHNKCNTKGVADTCQYIQQSEVDKLCDVKKAYKGQLFKFLSAVDQQRRKLIEQKKAMLNMAQIAYDKILADVKRSYQNMKIVIEAEYDSQEATLSQTKQEIKNQMTRVNAAEISTNKIRGSAINVNTFLSLQDSVSNMRDSVAAIESLKDSLHLTSLIFEPSKDVQKLLSQTLTFGSVIKPEVDFDIDVSSPDIRFPIQNKPVVGAVGTTNQSGRPRPAATPGQIKARPIGTYNVRSQEDKKRCDITGIAITPNGQRLLVDKDNQNVKLFSQDMRFLSSVSMPGDPWDITMVNDREYVITVGRSLVALQVAGRQLRIKDTIYLPFDVYGISYNNGTLYVTTGHGTNPTQVKALDRRGTEQWSVEHRMFENARYVCINSDSRWIAVTDHWNTSITVLDANSGAVITHRQLEENTLGKWLLGVSVDNFDNIFVCGSIKIEALSEDLKTENVLFNLRDKWLKAIAYDKKNHQLTISHGNSDSVSCLQLS